MQYGLHPSPPVRLPSSHSSSSWRTPSPQWAGRVKSAHSGSAGPEGPTSTQRPEPGSFWRSTRRAERDGDGGLQGAGAAIEGEEGNGVPALAAGLGDHRRVVEQGDAAGLLDGGEDAVAGAAVAGLEGGGVERDEAARSLGGGEDDGDGAGDVEADLAALEGGEGAGEVGDAGALDEDTRAVEGALQVASAHQVDGGGPQSSWQWAPATRGASARSATTRKKRADIPRGYTG